MFKLSDRNILLLEKIAKVSKMDCWFYIDRGGKVRDLESRNRHRSTRNSIRQLIDGMSKEDFAFLTEEDKWDLIQLMLRLC